MRAFLIGGPLALENDERETLVANLWELGTAGIEEKPAGLLAYFQDDSLTAETLARDLGVPVEATAVPDVDWVARFREGFRAFAAGAFWIAPVWETSSVTPPGHVRIVVDPGRAFGTGTHESTALCLEALARLAGSAGGLGRVADIGTGSGILAVAAARLGTRSVVASDIDPESIDSARRHASLNEVRVHVLQADGARPLRAASFDTVVANITAPLLVERAAEIAALARPGAFIVLAGLLEEERERVISAYAASGDVQEATVRGEWCSLTIARR